MIFIYWLGTDSRFLSQVEELFASIKTGANKAITSMVSVVEVLSTRKYIGQEGIKNEVVRFFQESDSLLVYPVDWEVSLKAGELRREHKYLRTPDALQLATAVVGGAKTFVTNDARLRKMKIAGLKIRPL